ncbi:MAG: histidine phosphatase family protein [Microthrixaceae bacterium]|nr:histidine phosphatase family protein [Microthrixaceae bacterium]
MTLYLVRHGSAGSRNGTDPRDSERHLDPKGLAQSDVVAGQLCAAPISRVLSSPLPRCIETVEPLAQKLGLTLEVNDALREGADPALTWSLIEDLGASTVVMCSHGDVIPEILSRSERRGTRVAEPRGFSKGSIWTLRGWDGTSFAEASWDSCRSTSRGA